MGPVSARTRSVNYLIFEKLKCTGNDGRSCRQRGQDYDSADLTMATGTKAENSQYDVFHEEKCLHITCRFLIF